MDQSKILGNIDAMANIAVKDMAGAKVFYEETLGLTPVDTEGAEAMTFSSGGSMVIVYRSEFAGTNKATVVTWDVGGQIDSIVQKLKAKGITFEQYDMPQCKFENGVHVMGPMKVAWFKDPEGNILSLFSRSGS